MIACFEKENLKKTIIAGILLLVATFFVTVGVAEISFPETILTFTDQEWLLDIWPKAYRYNIHVGVGASRFRTRTNSRLSSRSTSSSPRCTWTS